MQIIVKLQLIWRKMKMIFLKDCKFIFATCSWFHEKIQNHLTAQGFVLILGIRAFRITWLILTLLLFFNDVMELLRQSINSYILWCTFTRVRYLLFPTLRFYLVELVPYLGVRLSLVSNQAKCLMIASSLF